MSRIILASGSFIRRKLMTDAGLDFDWQDARVDEDAIKDSLKAAGAKPRDVADALAEAKAVKVSAARPGDVVIGADQIMVFEKTIYDKPKTLDDAKIRLKALRGKTHELMGAIVVANGGAARWRHLAITRLHMRDFSDAFLDDYLARGGEDLLTSVGAYKFEGLGAQLFSNVEGDFFSILGLSLLPLLEHLRENGDIDR